MAENGKQIMDAADEPGNQKERASWGSQLEFILTCVGFAVGLGNVWRFPYLCFKNGGGAFLIPYVICLLLVGIPLFYMELCLGQYSSLSPIKIWRMNPWFKGLGISMLVVSGLVSIYYAVIIAYCTYFLFASMRAEVPWRYCNEEWSTCNCRDGNQNDTLPDPWNGTRSQCLNFTALENSTTSASDEYFKMGISYSINMFPLSGFNKLPRHVLQLTDGIHNMEALKWDITLCNLFVWLLTFVVLSKGIKSLGKVVYFSAIFPYVLITILLIRGCTLEGYMEGIKFYLTPDFTKLTKAEVWSDAAVQIFFSLGTCIGGLIAMSSYNEFHNNVLRDAFLIPLINCFTSFYAGFVTFAILGFMAHKKNTTVEKVAAGGPGLAFIVYPEALAQMPVSPLWSVLFFLMMMNLGFSTLFSMTETAITGIYDQFEGFMNEDRKRLYIFRLVICLFFFALGLPMTTKGGLYMLNLLDNYVGGFPLLIVGLVEIVVVVYVYGMGYESEASKTFPKSLLRGFYCFKSNIEMMIGVNLVSKITFYYFGIAWCVISPLILLFVVILKAYQYEPLSLGIYIYPDWANALGWLVVVFSIISIPAWCLFHFITKDISRGCRPKNTWGPKKMAKQEWSFFIHPFKRSRTRLDIRRARTLNIDAPLLTVKSQTAPGELKHLDEKDTLEEQHALDQY